MSLFTNIKIKIKEKIEVNYGSDIFDHCPLQFDHNNTDERAGFGDISTNIAFLIGKKEKKNPREIAEKLLPNLSQIDTIIKIEIAGPGFLNIFLDNTAYNKYYLQLTENFENNIIQKINCNEKYHLEFVSANPTGPLHIGHGRGAIIGDILQRIMEKIGISVHSEYYINDAGIQIEKLGKSIYHLYAIECKQSIEPYLEGYRGEYLTRIVDKLIKKYTNTLLDKSYSYFSEYGEKIIVKEIKKTLLDYQVKFNSWFSEKTLHEKDISDAIALLKKKEFAYTDETGVIWFRATHFGDEKDRVLKKTDGSWTYTAADIAYLQNKLSRGFTKIIMVLGQDHHSFKTRMEAITQALGYKKEIIHIILYQLITLKHGEQIVRMSKRKGNSIELQDVIDNLGPNAARFFYLNRKADAHLDLDIQAAQKVTNENPVFYIQYAYVRIKSILDKYPHKNPVCDLTQIQFSHDEKGILKKIAQLSDTLNFIITHFEPHLIAYYTLELAHLFHSFYAKEKIITESSNQTAYRIGLLILTKKTFEICATLLGITFPEKM